MVSHNFQLSFSIGKRNGGMKSDQLHIITICKPDLGAASSLKPWTLYAFEE